MRFQINQNLSMKRLVSLILAFVLFAQYTGIATLAADSVGEDYMYFVENSVPDEIIASNVFYLASTSGFVRENGATARLKLARGGDAENDAAVTIKISDVTAKYGVDYKVRVSGAKTRVDNPKDNASLLEMMAGEDYTQSPLIDESEYLAAISGNELLESVTTDAYNEAIRYIEDASGLSDASATDASAAESSLNAARSASGIIGEVQRVTTEGSTMFEDVQKMANVVTDIVTGATLRVEFAAGEHEKYIEIEPINNRLGDGVRYFYIMLGTPEGATNSAMSSVAVTILDDEIQEPSVMSFSQDEYDVQDGVVRVEVTRSGALNTIAEAHLSTQSSVNALAGKQFSPVDADIILPMGVDRQIVEIPVDTSGINGKAQFELALAPVAGCTLGIKTAVANLVSPGVNLIAASAGIIQASRVGDIKLGNAINVSSPSSYGQSDHFKKSHYWTGSAWHMEWVDNTIWHSYKGSLGATWDLTNSAWGAEIAGAQLDWVRTGDHARISVGFADSSTTWGRMLGDGSASSYAYMNTAHFDRQTINLFAKDVNALDRLMVYNDANCDDCNVLEIFGIKPIFRPFVVDLVKPEGLTFLQADGTVARDDNSTFAALNGAQNDSNAQLIVYAGDSITVNQTLGASLNQPYTRISSIQLIDNNVGNQSPYTIIDVPDNGATTATFNFTKDLINSTKIRYIKFVENQVETFRNPTGTFGMRGEIKIQPTFAYKNAEVKIIVPNGQNYGYFNISGTDRNISASTSFTYHLGDTLKISTVMRSQNGYEPTGFMLSYKLKKADANYAAKDVFVPYQQGSSILGTGRLNWEYVELTPVYQLVGNIIKVRVKTSDVDKLKADYGIAKITDFATVVDTNGTSYREYIASDIAHTVSGKIYSFAAAADSSAYYPVWKIAGDSNSYTGGVFYITAGHKAENNIITLSFAQSGADYYTMQGDVFASSYNLFTHGSGGDASVPMEGALVSVGGAMAIADSVGHFETEPFRAAAGTFLRYILSVNGIDEIRTMYVAKTGSPSSKNITVATSTGVTQNNVSAYSLNVGAILRTASEADIFGKVQISTGNELGGGILPLMGDSVSINLTVSGGVSYIKNTSVNGVVTSASAVEKVTGAKFVVYDASNRVTGVFAAVRDASDESKYTAMIETADIIPGSRVFLRLETDRSAAQYANHDANGNPISSAVNLSTSTTYADIFTGYTFTTATASALPVYQQIDPGIEMNAATFPILGNTGMNFDFPFFSIGCVKTPTGYRISAGISAMSIVDKVADKHITKYAGDTGAYYGEIFSIKNPISSFVEGLQASYKDAFKNVAENFSGATSALGAPTWKFDIQAGAYIDFMYQEVTNGSSKQTVCAFSGAGGYVGVSGGFKMAWYTILPVVFIPAYFGLDISGNVMGFFGAGYKEGSAVITYDDANRASVDFSGSMDKFNASVEVGALIQIYVGVGLAGTIGVRGGLVVEFMGLYQPSDDYSDFGAAINFKAGIWIDLFLFSVPLQYNFATVKFGSFKEYEQVQAARMAAGLDLPPEFTLRESSATSQWTQNPRLRSAFAPDGHPVTLIEDAYEHSDSQLLALADGRAILAFITTDASRNRLDRTVLKYAVFENGAWSQAYPVQLDQTADFQPSLADMGDGKVMISWVSAEDSGFRPTQPAAYLKHLDVYTAVIDTNTKNVSELTRLTTESSYYYDYNPVSVYDKKTGDRIVYYTKSGHSGPIEELANSYVNDCAVVYMLYDSTQEKWLFDQYFDNEILPGENREWMIENFHGQRFLKSPVAELPGKVPNIADFSAVVYNGKALYAYTIDLDGSNDTDYDKEIFLQTYDFATHKTSDALRLTNDRVSDALPQMVRSGHGETAHTRLFWFRDGKAINYVDVDEIMNARITDNDAPTIHTAKHDTLETTTIYSEVSTKTDDSQAQRAMSDFTPVVDSDGNVYIIWTQQASDDNGDSTVREVYATALIGEDYARDKTYVDDVNDSHGAGNWANPYRLTYSTPNTHNDETSAAIVAGNLMIVHNAYTQTMTYEPQNPVDLSNFKLVAEYLEPCGAVETKRVLLSDDTPVAGETITVSVTIENDGLTAAKNGYRVALYEVTRNGEMKIGERVNADKLLPGNAVLEKFDWVIPELIDGTYLRVETQEIGMSNVGTYNTEPLTLRPNYIVTGAHAYQDGTGFHAAATVTNDGNAQSRSNDTFEIRFTGPYGHAMNFADGERVLGRIATGTIGVGETISVVCDLTIDMAFFNKYGYITALAGIYNQNSVYEAHSIDVIFDKPIDAKINGGGNITMRVGETVPLNLVYTASAGSQYEASYGSTDTKVASIANSVLVAHNQGQTSVYAVLAPMGKFAQIDVTVLPKQSNNNNYTPPPTPPYVDGSVANEPEQPTAPIITAKSVSKESLNVRVEIISTGETAFDYRFKVSSPDATKDNGATTEIRMDVSGLSSAQKANLTGVMYGSDGKVYNLGGEFSADGTTFVFYTSEKDGTYGIRQEANLLSISFAIGSKDYTEKGTHKTETPLDVAPYIDPKSGRTMMPLRFISELLSAKVNWDEASETVTIEFEGTTLKLTAGAALPGGYGTLAYDKLAGRTFVPIRYIMENFGANVVWFEKTQEVKIYR